MILDTLWKILFSKKQYGFFTTPGDPPLVWQKTILFPNLFFWTPPLIIWQLGIWLAWLLWSALWWGSKRINKSRGSKENPFDLSLIPGILKFHEYTNSTEYPMGILDWNVGRDVFRAELEEAFTLFDRVGDGQIDAQVDNQTQLNQHKQTSTNHTNKQSKKNKKTLFPKEIQWNSRNIFESFLVHLSFNRTGAEQSSEVIGPEPETGGGLLS